MYKIECGAVDCAYNMAGKCDAGVVSVREKIGEGGALCETYTHFPDERNALTSLSPSGFVRASGEGSVVCGMKGCAYNDKGVCAAERLGMERAIDGRVWCISYEEES